MIAFLLETTDLQLSDVRVLSFGKNIEASSIIGELSEEVLMQQNQSLVPNFFEFEYRNNFLL